MKETVIILGGPGGSGRSTLAKELAENLGYDRVYGGQFHREFAVEFGFESNDEGLLKYHKEINQSHPELDLRVDTKLFEAAFEGEVVIESMTFAPITKRFNLPYFRVWVTAEEKVRYERVVNREEEKGNEISIEEAKQITKERIKENTERWEALYGFDFMDFEKYYEHVFDTSSLGKSEMADEFMEMFRVQLSDISDQY